MRTHWTHTGADGAVTQGTRDLTNAPMSDGFHDMLAGINTASIVIKNFDGSQTEYSHLEFTCDWCDQYTTHGGTRDHPGRCPALADDVNDDGTIMTEDQIALKEYESQFDGRDFE